MAHITVIMNEASGAAAAGRSRQEQLRQVIRAADPAITVVAAPSGDIAAAAQKAAGACDVLVAAGGDGTVGTVARVAAAAGKTFGVIPFGTLNHFATDLGLPSDLAAAVAVLQTGRVRRIDYATAGDILFLNNASIGIYPTLVRRRQKQERTIGKWPAALLEAWRILRRPLSSARFTIMYGGRRQRLHTAFIFIGNNDYHLDEAGLSHRTRLDEGHLSLFAFRHHSRRAFIGAFLRSLLGFSNDPHVLQATAASIEIQGKQKTVEVACDGEVHRLALPLRFEIHPGGLQILTPAD